MRRDRWESALRGRLAARPCSLALCLTLVACTLPAAAGAAAPGVITHYPVPVETTPYGITTGPDGKIWFVDSGNHVGGVYVGRMTTSGPIAASDLVQLPNPGL